MAINEPSMFRSTDSWYPDAFARETESALTKALQQSFFDNHHSIQSQLNHPLISSSFFVNQTHDYTPSVSTVTGSGSGSDPETPGSKRSLGVSIAKTTTSTKRKSRASKRSMTTFIQADPANFRQMVQEVTGAKFEGNNGRLPVVKPEPLRQPFVNNKLQGLMLPTLDTSAYLLDVHNTSNNNIRRFPAMSQATENNGVAGVGDFYSFSSFPTLESSI